MPRKHGAGLNLDRKLGQQVRIGNGIVLTVTLISQGRGVVNIGIEGPPGLEVRRETVERAITAEPDE